MKETICCPVLCHLWRRARLPLHNKPDI